MDSDLTSNGSPGPAVRLYNHDVARTWEVPSSVYFTLRTSQAIKTRFREGAIKVVGPQMNHSQPVRNDAFSESHQNEIFMQRHDSYFD